MGKIIEESGNRYGRLVVLEYIGKTKHKAALWKCLCDCGNETEVRGYSLRSGGTSSCGCYQKEQASKSRRLEKGEASFNRLYEVYKRHAIKRNLEFSLTKEEFKILTKQNCQYCGTKPSQSYKQTKDTNGSYIYNGVDRVNNFKGYILDNCVSCCGKCNKMKNAASLDEFIEHVNKIHTHLSRHPCL